MGPVPCSFLLSFSGGWVVVFLFQAARAWPLAQSVIPSGGCAHPCNHPQQRRNRLACRVRAQRPLVVHGCIEHCDDGFDAQKTLARRTARDRENERDKEKHKNTPPMRPTRGFPRRAV